jgi:NADH dehydrogenase
MPDTTTPLPPVEVESAVGLNPAENPIASPRPIPLRNSGKTGGRLHDIIVVGGGAAGLELVTKLGDTLGRRGEARVTLVEKSRTHIWKPLLHSIAAGGLRRSQHELNYLAQARWHNFTCRLGALTGLDRDRREIRISSTIDDEGREVTPPRSFHYDTLVIAVGSVTNDFGTPGAAQYAVPLETPEQASRFNKRMVNACLRANAQPEPVRPGQLHVAIIGAGATGTELAAELHRTVREVVAYGMTRLDPERDVQIILIEAAPRILPALPERMSVATQELLESLNIKVRTNARVSEVRADGVVLADGEFIPSELVVWSAGVKGPEFLRDLGLEVNRINQLVVEPTLKTTWDDNIFAIGDCAACPREGFPQGVPPRAQAAHQMASHLVGQLNRRLDGAPLKPFTYHDFGSLVSLGRYSTVGNLMGFAIGRSLFIEGYFARMVYRSLYAMHQAALHGHGSALWQFLVSNIARRPEPGVKLH